MSWRNVRPELRFDTGNNLFLANVCSWEELGLFRRNIEVMMR